MEVGKRKGSDTATARGMWSAGGGGGAVGLSHEVVSPCRGCMIGGAGGIVVVVNIIAQARITGGGRALLGDRE